MTAVTVKIEDEDPVIDGKSPISILHEIFPGTEQSPSFIFSAHQGPSSHPSNTLIWKCSVETPYHECGFGTSHSKKTAKSKACLDVLSKLGYDMNRVSYGKPLQVKSEQTVTMLPLTRFEGNLDGDCINSFSNLRLKKIGNEHRITREHNPCGYLEILCRRVDCEKPSYTCEFKDFMFVTTVTLGSWTATGSAPNKKHSKYIASSSLITIIENDGKQH